MLLEPGVAEVANGKVPLDQEHVLEEGARGVGPVSDAFVERPVGHILQEH